MNVNIICDQILDPGSSTIEINGIKYKEVKNLTLKIAENGKGSLVIEHGSGYLESYASDNKDLEK